MIVEGEKIYGFKLRLIFFSSFENEVKKYNNKIPRCGTRGFLNQQMW